jgi:hypothetical protein
MDIVAPIFLVKNFAISRHQHRDRIRQQQYPRRNRASPAVNTRVFHPGVLQVHCVHQMMQSDMCIASTETRQHRREQPKECIDRIAAECAEQEIEPNYVGFLPPQHSQQSVSTERVVEGPASFDPETRQFGFIGRKLIGQNCEGQKRIAVQFLSDVKSILGQSALTGWESSDQTNFHYLSALQCRPSIRCA